MPKNLSLERENPKKEIKKEKRKKEALNCYCLTELIFSNKGKKNVFFFLFGEEKSERKMNFTFLFMKNKYYKTHITLKHKKHTTLFSRS